jgi:acetyl esterase
MMTSIRFPTKRDQLRRLLGAFLLDNAFLMVSRLGHGLPQARPERHGIEVIRGVPYLPTGRPEHTLDVYRPTERTGPLPLVLYVHGGGFRILSKDTHWLMGTVFARRGYVALVPSYRLAPSHPFPAAHEDAAAALIFALREAPKYGADPTRLVIAGESAGGNLALSLTVASCFAREEPWARAVFDTGAVPKACVPLCGMLQVSNPERLFSNSTSWFLKDRLLEVTAAYLDTSPVKGTRLAEMADPLCVVESDASTLKPLPPFFIPVGQADVLVDDTRRLHRALQARDVVAWAPEYPGEGHAFFALVWKRHARSCWRELFAFLDVHLGQ